MKGASVPTSTMVNATTLVNANTGSVTRTDASGKSVTLAMSREELAAANLPGRNFFGPMNIEERAHVLMLISQISEVAAATGMSTVVKELKVFGDHVRNDTYGAGVDVALKSIRKHLDTLKTPAPNP
jgi:hypothetical protein